MKQFRNICICRIDRMGDLIISTPVIKIIRKIWPNSNITLLASSLNAKVLEKSSLIDETIIIENKSDIFKNYKNLKKIQRKSFDLFLNLSPTKLSYFLCFFSKAETKATLIYLSRYKKKFSKIFYIVLTKIYCDYFTIINRKKLFKKNITFHQTKMMINLIEKITKKELEELKIEIPSKNILSDKIQEFSKKEIITIHLSNRWLNKYYDINNLINLIGKLQKTTKYLFFLTTENLGYEVFNDLISQYKEIKISDFDNNEIISKKLLTSNIFVLKNFNYENWIQIIKCSKKVITPESGCTHIASAFNVHTIVIYNYDNLPEYIYREYGPWKCSHNKLVFAKNNDINFQITSLID